MDYAFAMIFRAAIPLIQGAYGVDVIRFAAVTRMLDAVGYPMPLRYAAYVMSNERTVRRCHAAATMF